MKEEFIARAIFSATSGLSIALTGFGCDFIHELASVISGSGESIPTSSSMNMALAVALVSAVQASSAWLDSENHGHSFNLERLYRT